MKTSTVVVSLLLVLTHLACGAVLSKVSQHQADSSLETTINVRVSRVVPRHQCRRALRNLEVREREREIEIKLKHRRLLTSHSFPSLQLSFLVFKIQ